MKITAHNFGQMRQWFAIVCDVWCEDLSAHPEIHPVNLLDEMAKRTPARARTGLGMAIGDIMEDSEGWEPEKVAALDRKLQDQDLPTFSTMRLEFGKRIAAIVRRGRIRNEAEYYLARNAAELAGMPEHDIWRLLEDFEARLAP